MAFWILTGLVTLGMGGILALVLLRSQTGTGAPAAAYDLEVYRQQLKDLDRDLARGIVTPDEAGRMRTEISRRILAADAQVQAAETGAPRRNGPAPLAAGLVGLVIALGTGALYLSLGAPGYGDFGLDRRIALAQDYAENRPSQAEAEAQAATSVDPTAPVDPNYLSLVKELRRVAQSRPEDAQGQALLSQHEARLGNFKAAYKAKARYIALSTGEITAADLVDQAELQVMAAGGYVSPEAEALLLQALSENADDGRARYYLGLLMGQIGRPDRGYQIWADTLRQASDAAPWRRAISAQIPDMAAMAGVDYRPIRPVPPAPADSAAPADATSPPPDALPGPSRADIEAMQEMSRADRQEMIEGMVSGLATRLATQGGTPPEWARLITTLGVLGRLDEAREIHAEAATQFAGDTAALDVLEAALTRVEANQ